MAEKQASYIQASSHPADTDRLVLEGLLNPSPAPVSGAAYGVGPTAGDLLVTQNGTPNMSVNVAAGHVWIDGTESAVQGAYHGYNDATKNLVVAASDPTNPRKDLVVAKVQDAAYSGAVNAWTLAVVTGTPAASPVEPAVPANAVVLAMINVAALATTITNANITDRRRRACGLSGIAVGASTARPAAPYVGQVIYETDTETALVWNGTAWKTVAGKRTARLWVPARNFHNALGAPTFGTFGSWSGISYGWAFPDGSATGVVGHVMLPDDYDSGSVTYDIYYQGQGGPGNFRMSLQAQAVSPTPAGTETMNNAGGGATLSDITAYNGLAIATGATIQGTPAGGKLLNMTVARDGGHANDTTSNTMWFYGVRVNYLAWR